VTNSSKRKGDVAELEGARLLEDLLGYPCRRKLGAGRSDDTGDIDGLPNCTIQVCSRSSDVVAVGVVRKPVEAEQQARRAGNTFAATMLRVRGGTWRIVLTPEQFATLYREATA
jgi:hypothetical protein